jgi:hypothetical protein
MVTARSNICSRWDARWFCFFLSFPPPTISTPCGRKWRIQASAAFARRSATNRATGRADGTLRRPWLRRFLFLSRRTAPGLNFASPIWFSRPLCLRSTPAEPLRYSISESYRFCSESPSFPDRVFIARSMSGHSSSLGIPGVSVHFYEALRLFTKLYVWGSHTRYGICSSS